MELIGTDGENHPAISEERSSYCIACGHCEAVCPNNAITLDDLSLTGPSVELSDSPLASNSAVSFLLSRRSIRVFRREPVPIDIIGRMIDIARFAPSGVNRHTLKWVVVHDTTRVQELSGLVLDWMRKMIKEKSPLASWLNFPRLLLARKNGGDPICREAPHVIFACAPREDKMAAADATIALAHLELNSLAYKLGTCWAGYLNVAAGMSAEVRAAAGIPENHAPLGAMLIGFPKYTFARIPKRKPADIVWIRSSDCQTQPLR